MPPKTIKCEICGNEVTKRKSLAWNSGRACRSHEEVKAKVQEDALKEEQRRLNAELNRSMAFYAGVSFVRVYHTMLGIPVSILLGRIPRDIRLKVAEEVERQGEKMSSDEIFQSMYMADEIRARAKKVQEVTI